MCCAPSQPARRLPQSSTVGRVCSTARGRRSCACQAICSPAVEIHAAMEEVVEEQVTATIYPSLLETPEFREAIDTRSKTIEEILEILKNGTILWKVRSYTNWYRRKYFLDDKNGTIRYEPTHKSPCFNAPDEIIVDDIIDVRKGWRTDTFNRIEKTIKKKQLKFPTQSPVMDEVCCFSVIHGRNKKSLDLVAPNPKVADLWVHGLCHLITVLKGLHQEERFERWLEQQFKEADVDNNGSLNFEESLKLLNMLNVKMTKNIVRKLFEASNTNKNVRDGEQVLDSDEFVTFFMALMSRPEIKDLYTRYSRNGKEMDVTDLMDFFHKEQKAHAMTKKECISLIEAFEQSQMKNSNKLSLIGFTNLLMSEHFEVFNQRHKVVYQDMSQPLSHYYIATSHNTYLTGGQLRGESSVEGYINALKLGCRCVELDCWDGPNGEPVVYHGYTLTTKILFQDVLIDAIKPYAFYVSEYPVILSLENHCSEKQQERLTQHMVQVFGDMLYTDPVDENMECLPAPNDLKCKIIVKAKKLKPPEKVDDSDSSSGEESEFEMDADSRMKIEMNKNKNTVAEGLSNIVNICQAVHFRSFEHTQENVKCYQMSSFSEAKAEKFIETKGTDFVRYNTKHLSRIYPAGTRTRSSNFKPIPFWNVGCQMVALNYQHLWKPMFYNEAKFRQNGVCGYVLKPEFLRKPIEYDPESTMGDRLQIMLKLTIISGQHIPKPDGDDEEEIVDPYVKVKIVGHPKDAKKNRTDAVRDNGFNPRWNCEMVFNIKMPELAMVHFIVKDMNTSGKNATLGTYALPFTSLEEGYRHVYMMDYTGNFVSPASLFVHISIIS